MRHCIIRFIVGIVWITAAVFSAVKSDFLFAAIYAVLGIAFLFSAYSAWMKGKGNRE